MDELIEKYVTASINYGKAQEEGDAKTVNNGLLGFEAEMLLQEWKKGNLSF